MLLRLEETEQSKTAAVRNPLTDLGAAEPCRF